MENAGLKPKEFAERLGISSAYVSDLLNGKRRISTQVALKIEKEFKKNAEELLIHQVKYELEQGREL
jgi:addiction module HigA family antidote